MFRPPPPDIKTPPCIKHPKVTFETTIPQCGNIQEITSEKIKSNMQENRKCLIKIIETIQFLGRQGLALRGDERDENSSFMQLLKLRSKDFLKLKEWLEKKTEKYTSHDIQNELLKLMAHQILRDLTDEMRDSQPSTQPSATSTPIFQTRSSWHYV